MEEQNRRSPYWDNLKGILILLVVIGHSFQLIPGGSESAAYKLIYLFHMPLFVFCSGYLASYAPNKILKGLLVPYVLLQIACCLCTGQTVQFTTPYWMLWYLPALAVWRMSIPFLDLWGKKFSVAAALSLLLLGLLAGFDDTIGYYGTLSRIFVFAPYFALGYYAKRCGWFRPGSTPNTPVKFLCILAVLIISAVFVIFSPSVRPEWLYGTYGYTSGDYTVFFRLAQYAAAAVLGLALLIIAPRKTTFFSAWGRESFMLYITHIALLPVMERCLPLLSRPLQYAVCVFAAAVFCAVLPLFRQWAVRCWSLIKK